MKEKIMQVIYDYFDWIGCASCRFYEQKFSENDDICDGCTDAFLNWAISKDVAESFANKIMKIIKEEKQ